jgi:prenyltransferase beta subunit
LHGLFEFILFENQVLGCLKDLPQEKIIDFVLKCQHENGGFSGNIGHDAHLLYTLSAVQILAIFRKTDLIDKEKLKNCKSIEFLTQRCFKFTIRRWFIFWYFKRITQSR